MKNKSHSSERVILSWILAFTLVLSNGLPVMAADKSRQDITSDLADQEAVTTTIGGSGDRYYHQTASGDGGALYIAANVFGSILPSFVNNYAPAYGGAIEVGADVTLESIKDSTFENNFAADYGGAISILDHATITSIRGSLFYDNHALKKGGAICTQGTIGSIEDSDFAGNYVRLDYVSYIGCSGGAIDMDDLASVLHSITSSSFTKNFSEVIGDMCESQGGAIYCATVGSMENLEFTGNYATVTGASGTAFGGAIMNASGTIESMKDLDFTGNYATVTGVSGTAFGGAIMNDFGTIESMENLEFTGNYAKATGANAIACGGAICNSGEATITNIASSKFIGNYTEATGTNGYAYGGAVANRSYVDPDDPTYIYHASIVCIKDTNFISNYVEASDKAQGGAIWTNNDLTIMAVDNDVLFSGNKVLAGVEANRKGSAIYVDQFEGAHTLTLQANSGRKIIFEDDQTIEGNSTNKYNVAVKGGGTVEFLQENTPTFKEGSGIYGANEVTVGDGGASGTPTLVISNLDAQTLTFNNGNIDFTRDAKAKAYEFSAVNLTGNGSLKLDVDLAKNEMDSITTTSVTNGSAKLYITALTLLTDSTQGETPITFTNNTNLASATQYTGKEELSTHINKYKVNYDNTTGVFTFTKSGPSGTTTAVGDGVNVTNFVWLETVNNLQKRLGDLRGGEESDMAWARFQRSNDDYDGARKFNVSGNMYQVGYDFALKNQVASRGYFGVSLDAFDGTQSYKIGGGDVKSMSLGAYYTKIYDSGHYFDFILRYGRQESDSTSYDATAGLSGILTKLDYAMNSVTLSGEYGYRWNMGNAGLYLEPQAEFIYGYLSGAQATSSTNYLADIDSTNHFVTRLGLAFGQRVKNFNYYLRGSYYHDFAGTIHVKYGGTPYQQDSAQNWWEVSLGGGWNISKLSYFYAELTKHFKDVSNSLNFNLGFRFTL